MSKLNGYEVVGYEEVEVDRLSFHPAAMVSITNDAAGYMSDQIENRGVIHQDLLVLHETLEVIDGCRRLIAARNAGFEKVRCKMIMTDNPRQIVMDSLTVGRYRTTGQRVMAYLELHGESAISAYNHDQAVKNGQIKTPMPDDLMLFTAGNIASLLKVKREDVSNGVKVEIAARSNVPEIRSAALSTRENLFAGGPIRKAISMLKGAAEPQQGQKSARYGRLLSDALKSMNNSFNNWNEIDYKLKDPISKTFYSVMSVLPEDLKIVARKALEK